MIKFPQIQIRFFEHNGIKIAVDNKLLYLVGTTLDYSGGLNGKGFVFVTQMQAERVVVEKVFHYKNMAYTEEELKKLEQQEYQYGFTTKIESETFPVGLNKDIVRKISRKKNEQSG